MVTNDLKAELEKFENMLIRMADDTRLNQDYFSDPRGTMTREGIREDIIDVMTTGSIADIRDLYIRAELPTRPIIVKIYEP